MVLKRIKWNNVRKLNRNSQESVQRSRCRFIARMLFWSCVFWFLIVGESFENATWYKCEPNAERLMPPASWLGLMCVRVCVWVLTNRLRMNRCWCANECERKSNSNTEVCAALVNHGDFIVTDDLLSACAEFNQDNVNAFAQRPLWAMGFDSYFRFKRCGWMLRQSRIYAYVIFVGSLTTR